MTGTVNLYHIFLGIKIGEYSDSNSVVNIQKKLATSLTGSEYVGLLSEYTANKTHAATKYNYVGSFYTYVSQPGNPLAGKTSVTDNDMAGVIGFAITSSPTWNGGKRDPNGIYLLVFNGNIAYTSASAGSAWNAPSTGWCGFHATFTLPKSYGGGQVLAAPIGDETQVTDINLKAGCAGLYFGQLGVPPGYTTAYTWTGSNPLSCSPTCSFYPPNGDPHGDAIASTYVHEIFETVTNANDGYYNCYGYENADYCRTNFGYVHRASDGSNYNVQMGGNNFMLQTNIRLSTNTCQLTLDDSRSFLESLTDGQIVGISIGCLFFFIELIFLIRYCARHHKERKQRNDNPIELANKKSNGAGLV